MSSDASVELPWGDGEPRKYRLAFGEIEELQEKTARLTPDKDGKPFATIPGPLMLYEGLCSGKWLAGDVFHTLRLGLIGGGMTPFAARGLLDRHLFRRPLEDAEAAASVLKAFLEGAKDDPLPKQTAAKMTTETATVPVESASAASMQSAPQSE